MNGYVNTMKVSESLFNKVADLIKQSGLDNEENREIYRQGKIFNAHRVKDINVRYYFDIYRAAVPLHVRQEVMKQANDAQTKTMLRRIISKVE